jgi:hypothetical protein
LLEPPRHRIAWQDLELDEDHLGRLRGRMVDVVSGGVERVWQEERMTKKTCCVTRSKSPLSH